MKGRFDKSRGQIAVLYAGVIAILLGAAALGTDVALMYVNWQHVQKTADSAAVAGANFLSSGLTYGGTIAAGCTGDNAEEAACTYAMTNDPALANAPNGVTVTEPGGSLQVVVTETNPYFFAKALNIIPGVSMRTYQVTASATAQPPGPVGTVCPTEGCASESGVSGGSGGSGSSSGLAGTGMFPVGLQCAAPCPAGSQIAGEPLHFGSKFVGGLATGNWQWLDVSGGTGGGEKVLENAIENGAPAIFSINPPNNVIYPDTGNDGMNPNVAKALSDRLAKCSDVADACSGINPADIPLNDPCMVIMPAVDFTEEHGKSKQLTIYAFALVYLLKSQTTATSINGCFISDVTQGTLAASNAPNDGALVSDVLTH
jgi:Putative Flp pilus-assembly TadE/G-like